MRSSFKDFNKGIKLSNYQFKKTSRRKHSEKEHFEQLIFIISHLLSLLTNGNTKEHKKTKQESPKKTKRDIPQPQSFRPTDELQKYTEILNIIKPYHHPNRDILITIAGIVNTLEQSRSIIQNIVFDTTRISQSALCIRTSLDEFNYTIEKIHRS